MEKHGEVVTAAAQTLERIRTYIETTVPRRERAAIFRELSALPIEELAAMNAVETEHAIEGAVRRMRGGFSIPQGSSTPQHTTENDNTVICASRGSALAMTQTRAVAARLARLGIATTILNVTTTGDRVQDRSLSAIGTDNLFVKELELALREGRAQYAVHSCKDLPSTLPDDMRIAAISAREDPRDAFCSERYADFHALPAGSRVGTSSLRRRAQLAALRGDLEYVDVRGNVDTRLRKLREGQYDAIVLACAGLQRLGARASHTVPFDVSQIVPAAGQGALAVETCADASALAARLREAVNDDAVERAVICERAALRALRGGCQAPIGVHARYESSELLVDGSIASVDGTRSFRETMREPAASAEQAEALGVALASALLERGAQEILAAAREQSRP